jgi:hypothetical protein
MLVGHAGNCLAVTTNFFATFETVSGSSNATGAGAISSNLSNRAAV